MNNFNLYNGVTIEVEDTNKTFHSFRDWGLFVANNNPIGEPKQYTNYIEVPARNGLIDLSEALSGRPVFTSREIKIYLAGFRDTTTWESVMSAFRNNVMGRVCKIIFDTDPGYYWRGRIGITDFKPVKEWGKFLLEIPEAEPYKYSVTSSSEPWLWDPFNFETDMIIYTGAFDVDGTHTENIPAGHMPTSPQFMISNMVGSTFTVENRGRTYNLIQGSQILPSIIVGGDSDEELTFTGKARVQIVYRNGSL